MNGDISRIPIQTLGAVLSLTDILPELPFPSTSASKSPTNSLLYDDEVTSTANNPNKSADINSLISQALVHTSTDNLNVRGEENLVIRPCGEMPSLLGEILKSNKLILQDKLGFKEFYQAQLDQDTSPGPIGIPSSIDESGDSTFGRKKKKKKKKKKRKYKDGSSSDNSGEEVSLTPEGESESRRIVSVVKVDNNEENKKISLKISFKKPTTPPSQISQESSGEIKKEKKKHRHHHKDKTYKKNGSHGTPEEANSLPESEANNQTSSLPFLSNGDDDLNDLCLFESTKTQQGPTTNSNCTETTSFIDQFIQDNPIPFSMQSSSADIALVEDLFKNELEGNKINPASTPLHLQQNHNRNHSQMSNANLNNNNNINSLPNNNHVQSAINNFTSQNHQDSSYSLNDILMNETIGGLESYLNASNTTMNTPPTPTPNQPSKGPKNTNPRALPNQGCKPRIQMKRSLPGSLNSTPTNKRTKRRKNELEGLQSKVNYTKAQDLNVDQSGVPGKEDGWDKTLTSLSNTMHERIKRRKRNGPNNGQSNSSYIYEEDDEYPKRSPMLNGHTGNSSDEGSRSKSDSRRNSSQIKSYTEVDSDGEGGETSATRRIKKKPDDDEDYEVRLKDSVEARFPHLSQMNSDQQRRMRQRLNFKDSVVDDEMKMVKPSFQFNNEDAESSTETNLSRFTHRIDSIFENIEDTDLIQFFQNEDAQNMNSKIPPETIVAMNDLTKICQDANKLKALKITNMVEKEKLIKLLSLLILNIRDGQGVVATFRQDDASENENKLWRELAMDRVLRSILSTEIGLHLMTSHDMPKEIYLEDFLEKAVQIIRFQLNNTIYPEYDPVYRVDSSYRDNLTSIKGKRSRHKMEMKLKSTIQLYHRIVECISELGELVSIQRLTDGIVLTLSSIGVSVFFVENVNELQLAGLKLITAIFYQYEAHRKLIIEDILASLSRLPTSKKNLRTYRLNSEDSIQMLTALALMLVQSVSLPNFQANKREKEEDSKKSAQTKKEEEKVSHEDEIKMVTCYKNSMKTAHMFLSAFLRKSTLKGEDDHRAIFENFVNDLLLTVNKPEWPAAEVMLSMLGTLLVQQFNNKSLDQTTRVASVDYLGTVASTLRRDAVSSQLRERDIDNIIKGLLNGKNDEDETSDDNSDENVEEDSKGTDNKPNIPKQKTLSLFAKMDRIQALRDALIDYLMDASDDPTAIYARRFYISQWLNDCTKEHEKAKSHLNALKDPKNSFEEDDEDSSEILRASKQEATNLQQAERRRNYISSRAVESVEEWKSQRRIRTNPLVHLHNIAAGQRANGQLFGVVYKSIMDYEDACIICKYLASMRPFSQSFDIYLSQICKLLSETSVAVRTKALRCLSAVVEADPDILARADIEKAVHARLLDTSTSVREAAIDLLGRFIACKPELSIRYYSMFSDRILDKGVSVRKRVIKILRDICLEQPEFPKIPEICVKMIRRINDEEGIKKLVQDVFQTMWFTPVRERDSMKLYRRVMNITDVVSACQKTGLEWFEQFLQNLLKKEETEKTQPVEKACNQIVDCLMQNVIRLEEVSDKSNKRLLACLATLHLISNIRPELMVDHAMQLQPYLSINCSDSSDMQIVHHVSRILELTVPLMDHPSETMIGKLEEEMVLLTLRYGKLVLEACVGCLGSIVNRVSKNFQLVRDCFHRFYATLVKCRQEVQNPDARPDFYPISIPIHYRSSLMRALFTVGLLCKHFSPEVLELNETDKNLLNSVFDNLMFFLEFSVDDLPLRKNALSGLGFLCARHHKLLHGTRLTRFYQYLLQFPAAPPQLSLEERRQRLPAAARHLKEIGEAYSPQDLAVLDLKCLVLENLLNFFHEEEKRMLDHDSKWKIIQNNESLKEMGDVASGIGSLVAQTYLKDILESFYNSHVNVRLIALSVITTILKQGLIHPIVTVPYLISMQTDTDPNVRVKADSQLLEIETKFPGFVNMRAAQGISLSYRLQFVLYSEVTSDHFKMKQQEAALANTRLNSTLGEPQSNTRKQPTNTPRRSTRNFKDAQMSKEDEDSVDGIVTANPALQSPQESFGAIRGSWNPEAEVPSALNGQLYSMLRVNRGHRRAFLNNLLNLFDDNNVRKRCSLRKLIYIADNLAYFPYQNQDEPLFLVHHIDLLVGTLGTNLLSSVRDALFPEAKAKFEEACAEKARLEAEAKTQMENQLRDSLACHQMAMQQAMMRQDHATAQMEHLTIQAITERLQQTIACNNNPNPTGFNNNPMGSPQMLAGKLTAKDFPKYASCLIDPEEEESEEALVNRLEKYSQTALQTMREAIHSSRACILLIMLKQYLREVYSITDAKTQKYSPTDAAKVWERPLTRKVGVRFHPISCLKIAGRQLTTLLHSLHDKWSELWKFDDSPMMMHYRKPPLNNSDDPNESSSSQSVANCYLNYFNDDRDDLDINLNPQQHQQHQQQGGGEETKSLMLIQEYLEFRKVILSVEHISANDDELLNGLDPSTNMEGISLAKSRKGAGPNTTIVGETHESEEDHDSDSDGGASRLMLARSAPQRSKPGRSARPKRSNKKKAVIDISSDENQSSLSDASN